MKQSFIQLCCTVTLMAAPWFAEAQQVRIMPVGDSITQGVRGQCGYRQVVSQALAANNQCDVTFVGNRTGVGSSNDSNSIAPQCAATNTPHEAVPGARADFFLPDLLNIRVRQQTPDIVIIHAGSNDLFQGQTVDSTVQDVDDMVTEVFDAQPSATILLMNLIPWSETNPNPGLFSGFPQDDVVMEDVTAEFAARINQLAATRQANGDNITLVDVETGFDSATMTLDGVHPNDNGENHIAYRVLDSLYSRGICGTSSSPFVSTVLPSNQWVQLSIPGNPGLNNTVSDVFSELPMARYNDENASDTWVVYRYAPDTTSAYELLALNSVMEPGVGYWVIQTSTNNVTVNMPQGSTPVVLMPAAECISDAGCTTVGLPSVSQSAVTFNMPGFPLTEPTRLSDSRIDTTAGPCAASGCTLAAAESNNVLFSTLFNYDPNATDSYRRINGDDQLQPWAGYWAATRPGAVNNNPTWFIGPTN